MSAMLDIIGSKLVSLKATQFNGVDEYAYIDNPSFKTDTQGACAFWMKLPSVLASTGSLGILAYGAYEAGNNAGITLFQRYNGDTTINATYRNKPILDIFTRETHNGTIYRAYGNHILTTSTWAHVVVQSNGSSYSYYVNGVNAGGTSWFGSANNGAWLGDISGSIHRLSIAARPFENSIISHCPQTIDELLYFNRPLTSGESTWLYNGGTPRNPLRGGFGSDLKSFWRMGESRDSATTIYDEIGSNNLTLVNMDASNYVTS